MGKLVLVRVDERLIHGVICVTWAPSVGADTIIAVDDVTAKDDFMKSIMISSGAGASGLKADILTVDDAVQAWKTDQFGEGRIVLIFKSPPVAYEAYEKGLEFEELQLGWTNPAQKKTMVSQSLHLSEEDVELMRKLESEHGVKISIQYSPQFQPVTMEEGIKGKF